MGSFGLQNKIAVFGIIINRAYGAADVMYALHSNHDDLLSHANNGGFPISITLPRWDSIFQSSHILDTNDLIAYLS